MLSLSLKELNRITLSKHNLLSKSSKILEVISRICGLNAQVASTPYLSLWNRVSGFKKNSLERELYGTKRAIKSWFIKICQKMPSLGCRDEWHPLRKPPKDDRGYYRATNKSEKG